MPRFPALYAFLAAIAPLWVSAADPLGPPRASLAPGQLSVGVEYSYAQLELSRKHDYWEGPVSPLDLDNMHTTYLSLSMGATEWLEAFVRIGGVTMDGYEEEQSSSTTIKASDFDYDTELIYGGGLRATFAKTGNITFGAIASYSYANFQGAYRMDKIKTTTSSLLYRDWGTVDAQLQQWCVGLGATWQVRGNVALYGGGLLHQVRYRQVLHFDGSSSGEDDEDPHSHVYKNADAAAKFGGYGGIEWAITQQLTLRAEGSLTEDSLGGSLMLGMDF